MVSFLTSQLTLMFRFIFRFYFFVFGEECGENIRSNAMKKLYLVGCEDGIANLDGVRLGCRAEKLGGCIPLEPVQKSRRGGDDRLVWRNFYFYSLKRIIGNFRKIIALGKNYARIKFCFDVLEVFFSLKICGGRIIYSFFESCLESSI